LSIRPLFFGTGIEIVDTPPIGLAEEPWLARNETTLYLTYLDTI
jgi:hypothetical protein